jgi:RNA polymerase-binding transcription factor DksA
MVSRPDTYHLSAAAYELLHAALVGEREAQRDQVANLNRTADELSGQTDHESVLARRIAERGSRLAQVALADIDRAIARIAAGTYGRCEQCGRPIPFERLEAIPHARHCVTCPVPEQLMSG